MLNELYDLTESVRRAGLALPSGSNNFKACPKGTTFRVLLDPAGRVVRIEHLKDVSEITAHRKYEVANGLSFPAFNIPPLYWARTDVVRKALDDLLKSYKAGNTNTRSFTESMRKLLSEVVPLWNEESKPRIADCLKKVAGQLASSVGSVPDGLNSFAELISRSSKVELHQFADDLLDAALMLAGSTSDSARDIIRAMVINTETDPSKIKKTQVILELADRDAFGYPANHPKVREWVNSRLMAQTAVRTSAETTGLTDAYGQSATGVNGSFPSVRPPILGNVIIRSMNSESPCQNRYGKAESGSFPVGQAMRQRMKDSMEWIGDPSRRGKTWQDISGACGYDKGLLFAYPSILPAVPEEMSEFATLAAGDPLQAARFESIAEGVVKALQGIAKDHPEVEMRVFALAKADTARTKLLVRASPKAADYIRAAEQWQEGMRNLPSIQLHFGEAAPVEPVTPFPVKLAGDLNTIWIRGGMAVASAQHLTAGDGLRLLLDTGSAMNRSAAKHLYALLRNSTPVLLRAGLADHLRDSRHWKVMEASAKIAAAALPRLLGAIGLLLLKLEQRKDDYMRTSSFVVGQFLALADLLHREYCRNVRKGDIPNQLIGNAMMPIALENPERAVKRLNDRMMVYQRWAFTSDGNVEGNRLGKWALKRLGTVTAELAANPLPTQASDTDKAQTLLGYLARQESETTSN